MTDTITIPGYSILRKLGQGGMASVYRAAQHSLEREVALKVMSPLLNSDPSFAARFKREARIVAQLSHASIVPVFEVGEYQSCHYLSMEYLSGGDLKRRLLDGGRDLNLALNVCSALGAALDSAHRKGFVHRDIKPENILFRGDGTPVLTDFGIARALDSGRSMTVAGMLVGTPNYMSPEQVKGLELDGRSDLYSLGIVFFELLTGSVPFTADSTLSVALKQVSEPLPALPPEYAAFQEFLDCLTAKDREQRFASGAEVVRALRVIGTSRTVRNRTLAHSPTTPGVVRTSTGSLQVEALAAPTPATAVNAYASQPTLAWPRVSATATPTTTVAASELAGRPLEATTSRPPTTIPPQTPPPPAAAQPPADPPRTDNVSTSTADEAPGWIRKQPLWIGAAALVMLVLVVGFFVGVPKASKGTQQSSGVTAQMAQTAQPTQMAQPALAQVAPVSAPSATTPPTQEAHASNVAMPGTPTPDPHPAQSVDSAAPAAASADTSQAQAEAAARRKRLSEERRQRKEEEARVVAERAAALQAEQLQAQETHIQELLVAAKQEYAVGALWQPAGANAADRYREILRLQPERAEALAGARRVANILAAEAAQTEAIGDIYNSRLLLEQIQSLQQDHPKLQDLQAKLAQLQSAPTSPDNLDRAGLDKAAKYMAKAEADLGHTPLDYHTVDDATDQYDKAVSAASKAPGLPSLRERLIGAYVSAAQTEIDNRDLKRARKLIHTARKHKWSSEDLDRVEASLQAADAPPAAALKEAGAGDPAR